MSMRSLEKEILTEAQKVLKNPKLKMKEILQWSTGDIDAEPGEIIVRLPNIGANICLSEVCDKRERKK